MFDFFDISDAGQGLGVESSDKIINFSYSFGEAIGGEFDFEFVFFLKVVLSTPPLISWGMKRIPLFLWIP